MNASTILTSSRTLLCIAAVALLASCATQPKTSGKGDYTFFPRSPDKPRIQYLTSFGTEDELGGQSKLSQFVVGEEKLVRPLWKPYGITSAKGKLYICDTEPKNVSTVDLEKRRISYLRPSGNDAMKMPINVAVDAEGTRYVTDTVRGQVLIYSTNNRLDAEIGKLGEMKPCGIAIAGDRLYVTDLQNHCVRVYDKNTRRELLTFPRENKPEAKLYSPTNVAIDKEGNIIVSDSGAFAVKTFDAGGNFVRMIGDLGLNPGRFALPKGVAVDREGRIYVVDAATGVVQVFDKEGRLLMFFGEPKTSGPGGLYLPAAVSIDYENVGWFEKHVAPGKKIDFLVYVTNQAGTQKVSVFGFLKNG